ncbi:hypothetical protein GALL_115100 [mine drainage metagenome]|uniref:Uncharacterized protein n=1 Tax=mine drainage metagenome TaxID=410659 RepID=A0A1J5SQM5_9ZZZZ
MKVSFTTKEYARLLELVYLGLWVAGARPEDPASTPDRYADVAQKAYGMAEAMGCAELVDVDLEGLYFPAEKLQNGAARDRLDRFMDDSFWEELASRLAERDLRQDREVSEETVPYSAEEEERLAKMEDQYWREFEQAGVDHLHLIKGGQG